MTRLSPTFNFFPYAGLVFASSICGAAGLRPLSTDRPDTTESPCTVDAGHYQFEMEVAAWNRDHEFSLGELNAKVGLDATTDLQVVMPFYHHVRSGGEGFGDVEIRVKHNLWGNDDGSTALALMPFIKLPTANGDLGNGEFEGGLIVPYGFEGPAGWNCAVMAEVDLAKDGDGGGYEPELLTSATASHELTETTGIFLELASVLGAETRADREAYFNTGITCAVTATWQLDGGVRIGLTKSSADFTPFLGMSAKF